MSPTPTPLWKPKILVLGKNLKWCETSEGLVQYIFNCTKRIYINNSSPEEYNLEDKNN